MSRGTDIGYTLGQCTDYVASVFSWVGRWGDAWQWLDRARAEGFATSSRPAIGSIAVWGRGSGASANGHVGIVTGIQGNGLPIVSEMNATAGPGQVDQRYVDAASAAGIEGYILPQQGATKSDIHLPGGPTIPFPGPDVTLSPVPGLGLIPGSNPFSGITDLPGTLQAIWESLTSRSFWWRAGFVVLGVGMIGVGILLVARESPSVENAGRMFAEVMA